MSIDFDHYLTQHFRHIAAPSTLRWNAVAAVDHHGKYFPADKDAAILEIGPGFGTLIEHLHQQCCYRNVNAVDVSPEVVAACNRILPGSTVLAEDTAAFLRQRPAAFDLVLMFHVLEHVPRDSVMPLLEALRASLKSNGKLIVEVPNIAHPVMGAYNRYHDFTHTIGFTDQSLGFVLRNAGFREVTVYGCRMPRKNPLRLLQRSAQDVVELVAALRLRLFLPRQAVCLAAALGASATK
ncbi:MAG: class I SAM-dependent methyltransferase [Candidatus Korobacteraceae bacterium]